MESTIVIKVKYGETLRRFNAQVNEVGQLNLDIDGLRGKVIGLFNFAPNADLTLTYIDEDGDVVTLVDEEDLCDVVRQSLNPVRITVKLEAEKGSRFHARSIGNSTPMKSSPRVQNPFPNLNSSVSEYLISVPEPLRETLSKMAVDLASKAASSSSVLAELVDCFSKTGLSQVSPVSEFQVGTESISQSVASGSAMGVSMTSKETEALRDDVLTSYTLPDAKVEEPSSKAYQKVDSVDSTGGLGSLNLNAEVPSDSSLSEYVSEIIAPAVSHTSVGENEGWLKKSVHCRTFEKAVNSGCVDPKTLFFSVPALDNTEDVKKSGEGWNSVGDGSFSSTAHATGHSVMDTTANLGGSADAIVHKLPPIANLGGSADAKVHKLPPMKLANKCPFPVAYDSAMSYTNNDSHVHPVKRSYTHNDGMGSVYHRGVQCDVCGVHPIAGPRFKSIVKEDYDLCSVCFSDMGKGIDYVRIDRPQPWARSSTLPDTMRGFEMKPRQLKLDSRFITDVNVMDGTLMAPSTPFTKIWQLRNSGTIVWPQGTKLVWIGGDKLSASLSIDLQISADGIPLENELDVAADFTAPELPGRYISYWRMASPSGQKFGQRVWVLIQVDISLKDSYDSFQGLNLNLPPQDSGIADPENVQHMMVQPSVDVRPSENQEQDFPTNDTLLVGGGGGSGVSNTVRPEARTSVSFPITQIASAVPSGTYVSSPTTIVPKTVQWTSKNNDVEQNLLKELEEMGFKHIDLNKEILRLNEYNLEQSLDDLCGIAEWDPILEELQEMGFCDKEMNKKLLKKNNGSIKRVVMELIHGEKA